MIAPRSVRLTRVTALVAVWVSVVLGAGCRLSLWSWSSESGTRELSFPPQNGATAEPTPLTTPTFESRY
jgi:hypothetical protein